MAKSKISRGDVVVARVRLNGSDKSRPFIVVQNDQNNARLTNVILAMVTSNTRLAGKVATQVLVDLALPEGRQTGLAVTSAIKCENLYTVAKRNVRRIGRLSDPLIDAVDASLKVSLDLK